MDETQQPGPVAEPRPLTTTDAAAAPARAGFTLRGRRWMYGATLAAAGVLAGSGVTYAVVSTSPAVQTQSVQQGGQTAGGRGPQGAPPDGQAPVGQAPDGQAPGTQAPGTQAPGTQAPGTQPSAAASGAGEPT